jgi:single-strand DNA-binding protein
MANETTVTLVGNLTADPDLRFTPAGVAMARITVGCTPRVVDRDSGKFRDGDPLFMTCTAWRDLAEHVAESLSKGARVIVTGRLRLSRWETEDGQKRSMFGLEVDEIGPSLRFATATVKKTTRSRSGDGFVPDNVPDDVWDTASATRPAPATAAAVPAGLAA